MLRVIAARWAADGHVVEVMSTQPSYKRKFRTPRQPSRQLIDGFIVVRVGLLDDSVDGWRGRAGRVANMFLFSLRVAWHVLRGRYDVVMTSTSPPVILGWAAGWAARWRGAAFVYHCMDVHPEIGKLSGEFARPALFRWLLAMDTSTCRRAARVVVLSEDMARAIRRRPGGDAAPTEVIANIDVPVLDGEPTVAAPPERAAGRLRVVFTGNVGRFQALDIVVKAMARHGCEHVDLVIMGEGASLPQLKQQVVDDGVVDRVTFLPHSNVASARALVADADLCLVSLMSGIEKLAFPSKTMTYLAEGKPILAVVEPDSDLARLVRDQGLGLVASVGDVDQVADVLRATRADGRELVAVTEAAKRCGPGMSPPERLLDHWSALLPEVAGRAPHA